MTSILNCKTHQVKVKDISIGGGAPVRVQSMTNTDTADVELTTQQIIELAQAGSELVRITVNTEEAAQSVAEIVRRVRDQGLETPIIGDFHYNGHKLLSRYSDCARALDKYRINPGNVGAGKKRDENFIQICHIAADNNKPVRIGVNGGSLNQDLVLQKMQENADQNLGLDSYQVLNHCMVQSALESTELALESGLTENQIIISCKVSDVSHLLEVYRDLSQKTRQPLHLGLTEAGMGDKGVVSSTVALAILLSEGIGDTIRVSLTPEPGGDRRREVRVAQDILQSLGLRAFTPSVTACPGCGRTTSTVFQELAQGIESYIKDKMPHWKKKFKGVENLKLAVMGCIVNGPGESKEADIGISLPGTGEEPKAPVYIDGKPFTTLKGNSQTLANEFQKIVEDYIQTKYSSCSLAANK